MAIADRQSEWNPSMKQSTYLEIFATLAKTADDAKSMSEKLVAESKSNLEAIKLENERLKVEAEAAKAEAEAEKAKAQASILLAQTTRAELELELFLLQQQAEENEEYD